MSTGAMISFPIRYRIISFLSWFVWKLVPGRGATKLAEFSYTEAGSGLDMLVAAEQTERRDMRLKYFRHALDEMKHSRMFRARSESLSRERSRTRAVLDDGDYIRSHGIRSDRSLFEQIPEMEFLAFVWAHEARAFDQFQVYAGLMRDDPETSRMFEEIGRDERFHISYSRAELERARERGESAAVRRAIWKVEWRRFSQMWLRFSRDLGHFMAGLWLSLAYLLLVGPFSIIARITEKSEGGLCAVASRPPAPVRAREMG